MLSHASPTLTGTSQPAKMNYSSGEQINFVAPADLAPGQARIEVRDSSGALNEQHDSDNRASSARAIQANATGKGMAAALAYRLERWITSCGSGFSLSRAGALLAESLDVSDHRPLYLSLYGTGIRGASSIANLDVTIGGVPVPVEYAGPQRQFAGLDQVNLHLPRSLNGKGETDLVLTVDGVAANTIRIGIH